MTTAEKFNFDAVFHIEDDQDVTSVGAQKKRFSPEEIDAIRNEAYAKGQRSEQVIAEQTATRALGEISASLTRLIGEYEHLANDLRGDAAAIAMLVGRRLAGRLMDERPDDVVVQTIDECMKRLRTTPAIEIHVHPDIARSIGDRIDEMCAAAGFTGRASIAPDPNYEQPECRIVWSDGEIIRSNEHIAAEVDRILGDYLQSLGATEGDAPTMPATEQNDE